MRSSVNVLVCGLVLAAATASASEDENLVFQI